MTLEVAAAVATATVVLVAEGLDDLGAGGGGARVVGVRVRHDDVDGAGVPAAVPRPRCGGRMRILATIDDPLVVRRILAPPGLLSADPQADPPTWRAA
jgi:hypothetical protein